MGRYLDIAKKAIREPRRSHSAPGKSNSNPYADRMRAAWCEINRSHHPAGMIVWLGGTHTDLYKKLTGYLPDKIQRLWEARAPLSDFEAACTELVECHRSAVELFRRHRGDHHDHYGDEQNDA